MSHRVVDFSKSEMPIQLSDMSIQCTAPQLLKRCRSESYRHAAASSCGKATLLA